MNTNSPQVLSYCGAPPLPEEIWMRWTLDPVLIAALAALASTYWLAGRAAPLADRHARPRQAAFYGGWAVVAICFISPLCALSVALFSARVAQHMILVLVAAPLLAWGRPDVVLRSLVPSGMLGRLPHVPAGQSLAFSVAIFALLLWGWHAPGPYDATLRSDFLYWTMHLSLLAAAVLFWRAQFVALESGNGIGAAVASLATTIHMSLLGALLTFAPVPLFASHFLSTLPWGLSALQDQQLGGLIMWVPGGLVFVAASLVALCIAFGGSRMASDARS